jgi:DnaJ-domain-containing protein 1
MRRRDGERPEEEVFGRFADRFGATARKGKPDERREQRREDNLEDPQRKRPQNTPPPTPVAPPSLALEVLGLGAGASPVEIAAAYKRMARTYHPDKVANEPLEVREESERRMKEINAAYSLLKRRGNGPAEKMSVG